MKDGIGKQWMESSSFYLEGILKALTEVQGLCKADFYQNNIRSSILWNNKNIKIEGKSIYWKEWHTAGRDLLEDLLHENNSFLGYHQFCRKAGFKPRFTKFFGLISAIPVNGSEP